MSEKMKLLADLRRASNASAAFIIDEEGAILAHDAAVGISVDDLADLGATHLSAAEGLARQMAPTEFALLFEGPKGEAVHLCALAPDRTLGVVFTKAETTLGYVRLQIKKRRDALAEAVATGDNQQ